MKPPRFPRLDEFTAFAFIVAWLWFLTLVVIVLQPEQLT